MPEKMLVNLTLLAVKEELKTYKLTKCPLQEQEILENQNSATKLFDYILKRTPNIYAVVTKETVKEKYKQISKSPRQKKQIEKLIEGGIKQLSGSDSSPQPTLLVSCRR